MPPRPDARRWLAGRQPPALRQRLGRHMLLSLVLIWALGSMVVLAVGNHFVAQAFDRALLDDAHVLAGHVGGGTPAAPLHLDLTEREVDILRFDHTESIWFSVFDAQGRFVGGDAHLAQGAVPEGARHAFSNLELDGVAVRRVTLRIEGPQGFTASIAQTTTGRSQLLRRLMTYSGMAQLWLLLALGSWLLRGIERDLQPLADLQDALQQRDAADLQPLPPKLAERASTRDVQLLGDAVNGLLARVEHSLHAQREFAGNVAHELRTPLAGIRAQAAHALAQDDPAVWRSELQGIAQAEQRASRTVDQLLALARAAESGVALKLEPLALDVLAREVLLRFLPRADALEVDLGAEGLDLPSPVWVRGNAGLIEGILNNLLDNALRYGRGAAPRITVEVAHLAGWALLSVTDNGPGVDAGLAERLQQRWAQGAPGLQLGQGAGLGLFIVARYAQLMGGSLALEVPAAGTGLAAQVRIPLALPPSSTVPG